MKLIHTDEEWKIEEFDVTSVNNKNKTKPHGQLLDEVLQAMALFFPDHEHETCEIFYVREKAALSAFSIAMIGQAKMAGMSDWIIWRGGKKEWDEITPNAIKRQITGNGKAEKEEVAASLEHYLGKREYKFDDESDAAAAGVAWQIVNKIMKPCEPKENKESEQMKE